jgi:hypothetical protein
VSDIRIEQGADGGWDIAAQDAAYAKGVRVCHMESGRVGTIADDGTTNPVTGRMHWLVDFDDGERGVFQQRSIAPASSSA